MGVVSPLQKTDYGGVPLNKKAFMKGTKEENKLTVQGVMTPVPAVTDLVGSLVPSLSHNPEPNSSTEVGALSPVVAVTKTSAQLAIGKNYEEKEKEQPTGNIMSTRPLETGGKSDSESSNEGNITVVSTHRNDEVSRMVEEVSESIAKLTTKKNRLSGAQRRRLRRMHQKGGNMKTRDVPTELFESPSTSSEAGKRFRSPEEQNTAKQQPKKKKSSPPSSKKGKPSHDPNKGGFHQNPLEGADKVGPNTKKVSSAAESSRQVGNSEKKSQTTRKRKMAVDKGKEPPSYAKVARKQYRDELCYAVIDTNCASGKIPADQHREVEDLVNNQIMEHVLSSDGGPQIQIMSCEFKGDLLMMTMASSACAETLKMLVDKIPSPWEGAKLQLVRKRDIPKLVKTTVYIKGWGSRFTSDRILGVLGHQNKGLHVKRWEVFHREEDSDGTLLVVGLDHLSMASLVKTKGMAFFVSKAVFFKIGKARVGSETPRNEPKNKEGSDPSRPKNDEGGENTITDSQEALLLEDHD